MQIATRRTVLLLVIVSCSFVGCIDRLTKTPLAWNIGTDGPIPRGFDSYSLFLGTSYDYSAPEKKVLQRLQARFRDFARDIGNRNLAVWVNEGGSQELSVGRGKHFLDRVSKWGGQALGYGDGPYLIVSSIHPDDWAGSLTPTSDKYVCAVGFRGISPERVIAVLNYFEENIRREKLGTASTALPLLTIRVRSWLDSVTDEDKKFFKDIVLTLLKRAG